MDIQARSFCQLTSTGVSKRGQIVAGQHVRNALPEHGAPADEQGVREDRQYFFDMMRNEQQGRRIGLEASAVMLDSGFLDRKSSPLQASSSINSLGEAISARAISDFCFSPCEQVSYVRPSR